MSVDKDGVRTLLSRGPQRHGGVNAELASFVRGSRDHPAFVALASHNDCLSLQRGIEQFFDGNEEGVHIYVEDSAGKGGLVRGSHTARILAAGGEACFRVPHRHGMFCGKTEVRILDTESFRDSAADTATQSGQYGNSGKGWLFMIAEILP